MLWLDRRASCPRGRQTLAAAVYAATAAEPMVADQLRQRRATAGGGAPGTGRDPGEKKFLYLHFGFETPTPAIMKAWGAWFQSISDKIVDQGGHFRGGREISKNGTKNLPLNMDSITGYTIIEAESLEVAEKLARTSPFISSIRVYEVMSK